MHSYEDRIRAVELYFRYGKRLTVVVRELGYPSFFQGFPAEDATDDGLRFGVLYDE
jgi:hypothetical protein